MNAFRTILSGAIFAPAVFCLTPAAIADGNAGAKPDENVVVVTDFGGRPPYSRKRVSAQETAEFARFEEVPTSRTISGEPGDRIQIVEVTGRPPFSRRVIVLDETEIAEFARFEETTGSANAKSGWRSAPGKIRSRR